MHRDAQRLHSRSRPSWSVSPWSFPPAPPASSSSLTTLLPALPSFPGPLAFSSLPGHLIPPWSSRLSLPCPRSPVLSPLAPRPSQLTSSFLSTHPSRSSQLTVFSPLASPPRSSQLTLPPVLLPRPCPLRFRLALSILSPPPSLVLSASPSLVLSASPSLVLASPCPLASPSLVISPPRWSSRLLPGPSHPPLPFSPWSSEDDSNRER